MNTVSVSASRAYDIQIGSGLLDTLGRQAKELLRGSAVMIVSDDRVFPIYGSRAAASLQVAGFRVCSFVFPHGEQSKNGSTYLQLVQTLAEQRLTRDDGIVALGGGVTGDLAGFAAATYLRGIALLQVPTTLLAMVDSSVGGKTAIDLPAGKNLCGAFYPPALVLCDTDLLTTLPRDILLDGCAEVIKYGMLGSKDLFYTVDMGPEEQDWEDIITQCVCMKRDLVQQDEFDRGARQLLNLGHTFGHALEAASAYTLSHGRAVAVGMAIITRAAAAMGFCTREPALRLEEVLGTYELPAATELPCDTVLSAALGDKKRRGDAVTLVVPTDVGHCVLRSVPVSDLTHWLSAGL